MKLFSITTTTLLTVLSYVKSSSLRNNIISRLYVQSTIQHIAEEVRLEVPFTLMTNIQDYPINQIPAVIDNNLFHNIHGHETAIILYTLFVFIAKYQICVPHPPTIKPQDLKRLPPSINFDEIYNQTKTALLVLLILFFKNVSPVL